MSNFLSEAFLRFLKMYEAPQDPEKIRKMPANFYFACSLPLQLKPTSFSEFTHV